MFSELLEFRDIHVVGIGHNGKDAIDLYQKFKSDIVFLDINMPEHDGFYGLVGIKDVDRSAFVIAITAVTTFESEKRLMESGVSMIVHKPFHFENMVNTVIQTRISHQKILEQN